MAICTEAKAVVRELLFKISVLKNFAIFSEKRLVKNSQKILNILRKDTGVFL